jgi:hypothetical protein
MSFLVKPGDPSIAYQSQVAENQNQAANRNRAAVLAEAQALRERVSDLIQCASTCGIRLGN